MDGIRIGINRKILLLIAVFLLTPLVVAYILNYYGESNSQDEPQITVSELSPEVETISVGKAIGAVEPTDLFRIDATKSIEEITAHLYLLNAPELVGHYSYLIFNVTIYVESSGDTWNGISEEASKEGDIEVFEPYISDLVVTTRQASLRFTLDGHAIYKVSIDGGSFCRLSSSTSENVPSPRLLLSVD